MLWLLVAALTTAIMPAALAQAPAGRGGGPPPTARGSASQDYTGYWVAQVTEQWHLRMLMPPKGDFSMLPLTAEARRLANAWSPAQDAGNECRAYGAAVIMRVPGRLHIHWADDNTLQIDTDSGTQTRLLHFGADAAAAAAAKPDWQGYSIAVWPRAVGRGRSVGPRDNLVVTTARMRPGYLRKNGVPYSDKTTLQEYFDTFKEPNGDQWLVVTSIVTDPEYLTGPYTTTHHFKKIPDMQGWDPTPCRADQPR